MRNARILVTQENRSSDFLPKPSSQYLPKELPIIGEESSTNEPANPQITSPMDDSVQDLLIPGIETSPEIA